MTVATLHLFSISKRRLLHALGHMAVDKRRARSAPGLRFVKLLGTSSGTTFMPQDADLGLWGVFSVWDNVAAADQFDSDHAVVRGWRKVSDTEARFVLQPTRWRGEWSGRRPFGDEYRGRSESSWPGPPMTSASDGPVAVITRARIRPRKLITFLRAIPPVAADAQQVAGSLLRIGIGEAPIGLQATFSVWTDTSALENFAYRRDAHREVVRQTGSQGWYSEELFARFAVKSATGTVRGASMEGIQRLLPDPRSS